MPTRKRKKTQPKWKKPVVKEWPKVTPESYVAGHKMCSDCKQTDVLTAEICCCCYESRELALSYYHEENTLPSRCEAVSWNPSIYPQSKYI